MPLFIVSVRALVPREELTDCEDRRDYDGIVGDHEIETESEEEALDEFHCRIGIATLDEFEIVCRRSNEEGDGS